jgi:histidinol dehydrogenase
VKTHRHPTRNQWAAICKRPAADLAQLNTPVSEILRGVLQRGDAALTEFTEKFDGVKLDRFEVSPAEIKAAGATLPTDLKRAIVSAMDNIDAFHRSQVERPSVTEPLSGVRCWRRSVAIERVGLYVPGGTAPLFSTVLMLAVPARVAGCKEVILCTPPRKDGTIDPAILYAADRTGVTRVFKLGGAQAIGALAFGTDSIPRVDKIFGPGNAYVTVAKQLVSAQGIAIDLPAGPSELLILADETAEPAFIAADLLSQAEHGRDSQVVLVITNEAILPQIAQEIDRQIKTLPRLDMAAQSMLSSHTVILPTLQQAMEFVNAYAPEHLILAVRHAEEVAEGVVNAGSVFLGHYAPESVGDYASGTNHTLPTGGHARAYSGVSLDSFVKKITFQHLSEAGLRNLGPTVETMARAEQLEAHARAVSIRLEKMG